MYANILLNYLVYLWKFYQRKTNIAVLLRVNKAKLSSNSWVGGNKL